MENCPAVLISKKISTEFGIKFAKLWGKNPKKLFPKKNSADSYAGPRPNRFKIKPMPISNKDRKFMSLAINLAKKNLGQTAPNPLVGAVLVKNDEILATGVTNFGGRPHAERIAIEKIADKSTIRGATLYSTLEPCCHFGKTPPCTDLVISSGIARVVIANQDPDLRVNGRGIEKLRNSGIEITEGVMENEARSLNPGFFSVKSRNLPFITLKIATSLDGKIALKSGESKWITGEKSRKFAHLLRSQNEGIITGAGTIKADNPALDCRICGLLELSPARIIISSKIEFSFAEKVFLRQNNFSRPIILITGKQHKNSALLKKWLEYSPQNQAVFLESAKNQLFEPADIFKKIAELGINSVLVEGGSNLVTQLLANHLVDELVWFRAPKIIGNDGLPAFGDFGFEKMTQISSSFSRRHLIEYEEDSVEILTRNSA